MICHSGPSSSKQDPIESAAQTLRSGGIVAFPTETVYGLGADAMQEAAVRRIYQLKGRPENKPLTLHVSSVDMARRYVASWPEVADVMVRRWWPGPLTLVVPARMEVPEIVRAGGTTIGVRCPDHPLTLRLIETFGGAIVGPSANLSGEAPATTADGVRAIFSERDVLVLDGGPCVLGVASTVVRLGGVDVEVLREGAISREEIDACVRGITGGG